MRKRHTKSYPKLYGALPKNEQDMHLFERLVLRQGEAVLAELYKLREFQVPVSVTEH